MSETSDLKMAQSTIYSVGNPEELKQIANHGRLAICYGTSSVELGKKIINHLDYANCEVTLQTHKFPDGEICTEYSRSIRGCDLFIIQSVCGPDVNSSLMELILAIDAAKRASANRITAIIPYYGYARQDRKAKMRQPISARVVADLLSNVGINHVVTVDIHVQQIQGFFSSNVPLDFLIGDYVFLSKLAELRVQYPGNSFVISSCDAGGTSRCRELAMKLNCDLVIVDKRRYADNKAEVMNVIGDVTDKVVVVYDDICDTAGSLCNAAKALKERGARLVYGCVTHPVLSGPACERIRDSQFEKVLFSDSIPISEEKLNQMQKVEVVSCSQLLANSVAYIHVNESKNKLYQANQKLAMSRMHGI